MIQKNIDQLAARLQSLGCGPSIGNRIAAFACFGLPQFEVVHSPSDDCSFLMNCVKGDQGLYDCLFYTALLKRKPTVPVGLEALDLSMGEIDWAGLYAARITGDKSEADKAGELIRQLDKVDVSGVVRFRHWAGTGLENLVPQLAQLRAQNEMSQRFYFLPDQSPISFDEATRFLQSRLMEKKMQTDRKLLLKNDSAATPATGAKGGKLLTKRTKANRKPGLFNR